MLKFTEGQTYICTKSGMTWFTEGKEYPVFVNEFGRLAIKDDEEATWFEHDLDTGHALFKLKGDNEKVTLDEINQDALETTYTLIQIRDAIVKAYQMYDNDSQRLAYLKGYFAK